MPDDKYFFGPFFALGFLSPWLLAWGFGVAIPIAIHLWRRQHRQEIPWSAMRFLALAIRKRSKRSRVEQWLLFALRTLAILLLAAAVARPTWEAIAENLRPGSSDQGKLVVLVLDSSYSMNRRGTDGSPRDMARTQAEKYVRGLSPADAVCLVGLASPPIAIVPTATFAHDRVVEELMEWKTVDTGIDLDGSLRLLQRIANDNRQRFPQLVSTEVVVFTDLGQNTWSTLENASTMEAAKSIADNATFQIVPCRPKTFDPNLAVSSLRLDQAVVRPGVPIGITAQVENFSDQPSGQTTVQFLVDNRTEASRAIAIGPAQSTTIQFQWTPPRPGTFLIEVRLSDDGLANDNARWVAVDVKNQIRILVLESIENSASYLEAAITPESAVARGLSCIRLSIDRVREMRLSDFDIVMLCNANISNDTTAAEIAGFANRGGGLIVWLGNDSKSDQYNRLFAASSESDGVMPFTLGSPSQRLSTNIDPLEYASPIAQPFRDFPESGLLTTPIFQYCRIDRMDLDRARVDLSFSNSDPFIISAKTGLGRSIWITTPPTLNPTDPDASWNSLAAWPSFVPLVQELVEELSRSASLPRNLQVGQPLTGISVSSANSPIQIALPTGQEMEIVQQGGIESWSFSDTMQRGPYRVTMGSDGMIDLFALNVDTTESNPRLLELIELPEFLRTPLSKREQATGESDSAVVEFSAPLLAALLAVLLGETLVTWLVVRGRT